MTQEANQTWRNKLEEGLDFEYLSDISNFKVLDENDTHKIVALPVDKVNPLAVVIGIPNYYLVRKSTGRIEFIHDVLTIIRYAMADGSKQAEIEEGLVDHDEPGEGQQGDKPLTH